MVQLSFEPKAIIVVDDPDKDGIVYFQRSVVRGMETNGDVIYSHTHYRRIAKNHWELLVEDEWTRIPRPHVPEDVVEAGVRRKSGIPVRQR